MPGSPRVPRWQVVARPFLGIRARSTAAALLVVAIAMVVGTALLLTLLRQSLVSAVADTATARSGEVVDRLQSRGEAGLGQYLEQTNRGSQVVQVLSAEGTVLLTSSRASTSPVSTLRPGVGQTMQQQVESLPDGRGDDPYLVVAYGVLASPGRPETVVVAVPLAAQDAAGDTVQKYLLAALIPLLALVGGATWLLVGRALRPVERIRSRVQAIDADAVDERVPVPGGQDEIARLAVTMNEMLDRLEAAQRSQRRFVADASHELRSPLATVTAGLDVVGPTPDSTSWPALRAMMQAETARMQRLVTDLLLLAKADDHVLVLRREDVDLDDILHAEAARLRVSTTLEPVVHVVPVRVQGDTAKLAQAVRNLVDNAVRAATGRVGLSLWQSGHQAFILVEDDGPGIDPGDRERIFERFVRLDESRERGTAGSGGSGLGLAIVAEVVRGHAGTVTAGESALGGASFELRLPTG